MPLAVLSGATGGIGRTVTEHLWSAGYSLIALGKTATKVAELQYWFLHHPRDGQEAHCLVCDVTQTGDMASLRSLIDQHASTLRLLVVCHGAAPHPASVLTHEGLEAFEVIYATDVLGTLKLCQMVGTCMTAQRQGSIVLLSSMHSHATYPNRLPYSVSKAAVCAIARALAVEWGHEHITVNSISPWQVYGDRTDAMAALEYAVTGEDTIEHYRQRSPLRHLVTPESIADAVLFLARNPSISGQDLVVDCAMSASMWHKGFVEHA